MDDQRFFDLAMKVTAQQSTDAEEAELNSILSNRPELKRELETLQAEARLASEVMPLVAAAKSASGEFPAYARGRLQTKVRQTLAQSPAKPRTTMSWGWLWALATAGAVGVVLALVPLFTRPVVPLIQVAILDAGGRVRGGSTNEVAILQQQWSGLTLQTFEKPTDLQSWQTNWPKAGGPVVKVIYDRSAAEVRVSINNAGGVSQKSFTIQRDLGATLREVDAFIRKQTAQ